jgi:hypothetical protein
MMDVHLASWKVAFHAQRSAVVNVVGDWCMDDRYLRRVMLVGSRDLCCLVLV